MADMSSNTAALVDECAQRLDIPALVAELRRVAAELRVEVTYDSTIHDVDRQAVALNNAAAMLSRAAAALSALAEELEEARQLARNADGDLYRDLWKASSKNVGRVCGVANRQRDALDALTRERDEALAALKASEAREAELKRVLEKFAGRIDEIEQVKAVSKFATEGTAAVKLSLLREARAVLSTKEMGS